MNPNHPHSGVAIGMVSTPGGHLGIGIGVPIMTSTPLIVPPPHHAQIPQLQQSSNVPIISPDSTEENRKRVENGNRPSSWNPQMLQSLGYPTLGVLGEPNMLYGIALNPLPMQNPPPQVPQMLNPIMNNNEGNLFQPAQNREGGKEIIHCKSTKCTLFPPNPNAPTPTTRDRPQGCRTVFVGGLPEKISESLIREIFERCGEITTIRMSKKNFCHIRFELESDIDKALLLSGYRIRIGSNADPQNCGRLHIDYAQARDDFFDWECKQRQLQREQRHKERLENELAPQSPSPTPVVQFSAANMVEVSEKLKVEDSFTHAVKILITWLEKECNKKNANHFYTMIQSTNAHVKRLLQEKSKYEDEVQKAKDLMKKRMDGLITQFNHIERVFTVSSHKKVWDHLTKAQRKNIDIWKKQISEIKNIQLEEALNERLEEEMDLSDTELDNDHQSDNQGNYRAKRMRYTSDESSKSLNQIKEENDALRCQLEAYKNEIDLIKVELKSEIDSKDEQNRILQEELNLLKRTSEKDEENCDSSTQSQKNSDNGCSESEISGINTKRMSETEIRLIALISTFLNVHPFGASLDYIWSYSQKFVPNIRPNQLEALMTNSNLFEQQLSGVGATFERKWVFVGFRI